MRDSLVMKRKLFDEIIDFKADEFLDRLNPEHDLYLPRAVWETLQDGYKAGFTDALIWLKEKGFEIEVKDGLLRILI
jgi:hypothetical protein